VIPRIQETSWLAIIPASALIVSLICWYWGWRATRYALGGVVAAQLLLCIPIYDASTSWWQMGFVYGTERHPEMAVGPANNLGAVLRRTYGYRSIEQTVQPIPADMAFGLPAEPVEMQMRTLMLSIYGITLLIACAAIAVQWRRRDRNFLLAATLPWLLFALLPPQIHDRYLGFAAVAAAVWIGASMGVGWMVAGGFVSFVAYWQIGKCMTGDGRRMRGIDQTFFSRDFFRWFDQTYPSLTWALLMLALILLFFAFTPSARGQLASAGKPSS
jgi:hypothetical protein